MRFDLAVQVPELSDSLNCLQQLLQSRVGTFSRLCHLQGKLELMLLQADSEEEGLSAHQAFTTPQATITVGAEQEEEPEVRLGCTW